MAKMFNPKLEETSSYDQPVTTVGQAVKIEGTFSGSGNVVVYGEVVGTLKTSNDLVIEESARIEADVEASNMTVSGEVHGSVVCHGQLQLKASGKIYGDVTTDNISVETGAVINGKCTSGSSSTATTKKSETSESDEE